MGRSPRVSTPDTVYHVICRGNNRQPIFMDNRDYFRYLDMWRQNKAEMDFHVFAYVLMTNHVHWLLKTGITPLSEIIHRIHSTYARWFNHRHQRVGHLFQGRYKNIICAEDAYLLALARYIHQNPIRSGLVKSVHVYPWSSYHLYASGRGDDLVETDFLLHYFSNNRKKARLSFIEFCQDVGDIGYPDKTTPQKEKRHTMPSSKINPYGKDGMENASAKVAPNKSPNIAMSSPLEQRIPSQELDQVALWIKKATGVTLSELKDDSQKRHIVLARSLFIKIAVSNVGIKRSVVANYLGKERSLITKVLGKWSDNRMPPLAVELLNKFDMKLSI